jgi:pimeloyl-ACP methyl ester carboxylesterase
MFIEKTEVLMSAEISRKIGNGPKKVLVLHGWFGAGVYDGFFENFDLNKFEFTVLENPGYGKAREETPAQDITDLARQQIDAVNKLGWNRFHIIGHSYGGASGLRIATLTKNRVQSFVGIAPVMPVGFDQIAAKNCGADENTGPAFMAAYAKGPDADEGPRMIALALDPVLGSDEKLMKKLITDLYASVNENTYKQYFLVWTGCAFSEDVAGLNLKSLFLLGQSDPFSAPNYVQGTKNQMAKGAVQVKSIPGGHFLTVSGKEGAKKEIEIFLA